MAKRLTEGEFERLLPHLHRVKDRTRQVLREVLVSGRTQNAVALEVGITRKAVNQMVSAAWEKHLEHGAIPDGWVTGTVTLPADLMEIVRDMEQKARARLAAQQSE
ncbi:TrfB-related DNA-binding protein [Burkholderia sp. Tr-20390]|uniref:TrfB-related DNA-binding protein n=1 Tax=Burkholderia sp. Tr-20390 TaxID=2703904 RepID=UPI0032164477